jgi:YD repeat-containing protein
MIARRRFIVQFLASTCGAAILSSRSTALADTVSYTYDALGRVKTVTYSNGASITYVYDAAGNRTTLTQTPPNSVQATLGATPAAILAGQSANLNWSTSFATGASINQGVGTVTPTAGGSVAVSPASTTTYTLTATGPFGPATAPATVTVYPLPTCSLSASPTSILVGQSATLTWTSANASSASISNGVGSVSPVAGGSVVVTPGVTTTYTLTVTGALGSQRTAQATVTVNPNSFNQTIQVTGSGPVNLRTLANNAGYNGAQNANIVFEVGNGVTITGAAGGIAIDTGTWPGSPYTITLSLIIKTGGIVRGGGGAGGAGGVPGDGGAGGDAVYCRHPITITIQSGAQVRGGGGGGGGASSVYEGDPEPEFRPGGGGGGGAPNGPGGMGDGSAGNGGGGTISSGGAGGAGSNGGGNGGNAGTYGTAGSNGQGWFSPPAPGGIGGAAGYCIRKNGHNVPVTNNGTTSGTIG